MGSAIWCTVSNSSLVGRIVRPCHSGSHQDVGTPPPTTPAAPHHPRTPHRRRCDCPLTIHGKNWPRLWVRRHPFVTWTRKRCCKRCRVHSGTMRSLGNGSMPYRKPVTMRWLCTRNGHCHCKSGYSLHPLLLCWGRPCIHCHIHPTIIDPIWNRICGVNTIPFKHKRITIANHYFLYDDRCKCYDWPIVSYWDWRWTNMYGKRKNKIETSEPRNSFKSLLNLDRRLSKVCRVRLTYGVASRDSFDRGLVGGKNNVV